jgi:hypothetical protein
VDSLARFVYKVGGHDLVDCLTRFVYKVGGRGLVDRLTRFVYNLYIVSDQIELTHTFRLTI